LGAVSPSIIRIAATTSPVRPEEMSASVTMKFAKKKKKSTLIRYLCRRCSAPALAFLLSICISVAMSVRVTASHNDDCTLPIDDDVDLSDEEEHAAWNPFISYGEMNPSHPHRLDFLS